MAETSPGVVMSRAKLPSVSSFDSNGSPLVVIPIDVAKKEGHSFSNTVTDHPVEEGMNISDHSRPNPDLVTLECVISNTPLSNSAAQRILREGTFEFKVSSTEAVQAAGAPTVARAAFDNLKLLRDQGALVTVATSLLLYKSVVIESLDITRDSKSTNALYFTMKLKQIRVVTNALTRKVVAKDTRAQDKVKKGKQTPKETDAPRKRLLSQVAGLGASVTGGNGVLGEFFKKIVAGETKTPEQLQSVQP